jgi:hypothetical protein
MAVGFLVPSLAIFWGRAGHNIRSARFSTSQHKNSCKKIVTTGAVAEVSCVIEIVHRSGG